MQLSKVLKTNPQALAQQIAQKINSPAIAKVEVAGAGFLNIFLSTDAFNTLVHELRTQGAAWFVDRTTTKKRYVVEYVSANPTGPLHLGHGRGGIIGDVLSNVLSFNCHQAWREYYINDAGAQIQKLGISFRIRCMQQLGLSIDLPQDAYHGHYLELLARDCATQYGNDLHAKDDAFFSQYAKDALLAVIQNTLIDYRVNFNQWFSEKSLHTSGAIEQALAELEKNGATYSQDGALWFKSTEHEDDKDRVLRKASGELTYIAADVAYLKNKFERADHLIFVLGQDHHNYATRLKGIAGALGFNPNAVDVILYQLVTLKEDGQQLRMSKRAGTMVELQEVIDEVGCDVARFFFFKL